MGYNYATYTSYLQTMIASISPDASFTTIEPMVIDYAEQRCYRDLNLLSTVIRDYSTTLTASTRNAEVDTDFVVVNQINLLTPAGSDQTNGIRVPLTPSSLEMVDALWPGNGTTGQPDIYGMVDQWNLVVGPSPDGAYLLEVIGTQRPTPLSVSNPNTFLTDRLPDLFMAASMIFVSGYMRNFGTMASDPAMSMSWEEQYKQLLNSAESEEARKSYSAASWTARPVQPAAQPQRG